jgi:hypothetical protein
MRMVFKFTVLLAAALQIGTVQAEQLVSRSEKSLACVEYKSSDPNANEGDFIERKCISKFGPPMWELVQEAVRFSFGFGAVENTPQTSAGDAGGAVEWWGVIKGKKFVARTVIKRLAFSDYGEPEKRTSELVVFKLLADGKSCVIGMPKSGKTENRQARKIAQSNATCVP